MNYRPVILKPRPDRLISRMWNNTIRWTASGYQIKCARMSSHLYFFFFFFPVCFPFWDWNVKDVFCDTQEAIGHSSGRSGFRYSSNTPGLLDLRRCRSCHKEIWSLPLEGKWKLFLVSFFTCHWAERSTIIKPPDWTFTYCSKNIDSVEVGCHIVSVLFSP